MQLVNRQLLFKILLILAALVGGIFIIIRFVELPGNTGQGDFRGYWSASYLLAHSENFADDALLRQVQREQTNFDEEFAIKTWNLPWILVWFLPYTWVSFEQAARLWFFTNILVLQASIIGSWKIVTAVSPTPSKWSWVLPLLTAILFPSTLVALIYGQVNIIVLGGIVGFLYFYQRSQDIPAGVALVLTTLKPHLVYLTLPIILVQLLVERRWRVLAAAAVTILASTAVLFLLRPTFLPEYLASMGGGDLLGWETATLTTYLSFKLNWLWIRLIGIPLLPVVLLLWWRLRQRISFNHTMQVAVLLSIITMPFGWSYDFVLLLFPLTQLWAWLLAGLRTRWETAFVILALIAIFIITYRQRIQTPSELYFFWIPLAIAALYIYTAYRRSPARARAVKTA